MRTVTVEWMYYKKDGKTCCRCEDSAKAVEKVIRRMKPALQSVKVDLELKETVLPEERMSQSNSVRINGRDVMEILNEGEPDITYCPSCSELTGRTTNCRTYAYKGGKSECVTEEMLEEAIIAAVPDPNAQLTSPDAVKGVCDCQPGCQAPTDVNE